MYQKAFNFIKRELILEKTVELEHLSSTPYMSTPYANGTQLLLNKAKLKVIHEKW